MNPLIECLGWTLVHFIWEGLAIALLLAIALRLLRRGTADQRYLAGCVALLFMVIAPVVTSHLVEMAEPVPAQAVSVKPVEVSPNPGIAALQAAIQPKKSIFTLRPGVFRPDFVQRLKMILPWLVMGWSMGVLALSCRLLAGWLQVKRWQRAASETLAETWRQKLDELALRLSISKPVRLVQSALVEVPTVVGWLRPVILLPASCLSGLTPEQLESILAHELAHIGRHDYLVNLLQSVVETLLFYHPAVWWVSRRIREERENCCDDMAVRICGDPVTYARALATLEEMRSAPAQLALAADGAPLLERVQRLLGKSGGNATPTAWPLAGTIVVIALMAVAIGLRENRAMASEPPVPETFITHFGVYHFTNNGAATELTVETNRVFVSASKGTSLTTASEGTWSPSRHWFVYIGKDWHVWAYDGAQGLWVVAADSVSSKMRSLAYLDEIPPDAVLKRLPKQLKKTALEIATPNNQARKQFEELIREAEARSKRQPHSQTNDERRTATGNLDSGVGTNQPQVLKKLEATPPSEALETRKYYVEPGKLLKALERAGFSPHHSETNAQSQQFTGPYVNGGSSTWELHVKIREYFKSLGVDFGTNTSSADKAVLFNDRKGVLFVRATAKEMEIVAAALERMNSEGTPPAVPSASTNPPGNAGATATFTGATNGTQPLAYQWYFSGTNAAAAAAGKSRSYPRKAEPDSVNLINYKYRKIEADTERAKEDELLTQLLSITNKEVLRKSIPMAVDGGTLSGLLQILNEALVRQVTLENDLGPSHPDVQRNKKLINELNRQVDDRVQGVLEGMKARVASLQAESDFVDAKLAEAKTNDMIQVEKPQINIKVKFVEVTEPIGNSTGFDWVLKDSWATFTTNPTPPPKFVSPYILKDSNSTTHVELTVTNSILSQSMVILDDRPHSMVMQNLKAQSDADILTAPEVTTRDNGRAQVQMLDTMTVVVGTNTALGPDGKTGPHYLTESIGLGTIFDVIPKVSDDGLSVELKMTASVTKLKGYAKANIPIPLFFGQGLETEATVPDGQTLILAGRGAQMTIVMKDKVPVLGDIPLLGRLFQSSSTSMVRKDLLVFVTPTLIHPDGTRYHSEAESNAKSPSGPPPAIGDETKKTN